MAVHWSKGARSCCFAGSICLATPCAGTWESPGPPAPICIHPRVRTMWQPREVIIAEVRVGSPGAP